jgi:Phosphate-selective porin O and P
MKKLVVSFSFLFSSLFLFAQNTIQVPGLLDTLNKTKEKKWSDLVQIRGYTQVRYNRLLETNPLLKCEQCDRSMGENGGFFLRRMRIIFYGKLNDRVYFYVQPDFASSVSSNSLHFGQLRDAYFDVSLDKKGEYRFRIGQSKVPFGFENMQSSQNRMPLDRNDALNSAVSNERDLGVFFMWAPSNTRKLYSELVSSGLKGSGDYGVFSIGLYNGQTANKAEANNNLHKVARVTYPFKIKNQIFEPGIMAYSGKYVVTKDQTSTGVGVNSDRNYLDQRIGASAILYPKPFGIMAEYNVGTGPAFNTSTKTIEQSPLYGGYTTFSYFQKVGSQIFIPFARLQKYHGGKKHELDARSYEVEEVEIGMEWQPQRNFELVVQYTISSRKTQDMILLNNNQFGRLLRIQAQLNF